MKHPEPFKALTIRQPWAWAVVAGAKRVENRSWVPPDGTIGRYLAIHAAKAKPVGKWVKWVEGRTVGLAMPEVLELGAILGVARVSAVLTSVTAGRLAFGEWFEGPVGWALDSALSLPEPIPCKGQLGLWNVPPDVAARLWRWLGAGAKTPRDGRRSM